MNCKNVVIFTFYWCLLFSIGFLLFVTKLIPCSSRFHHQMHWDENEVPRWKRASGVAHSALCVSLCSDPPAHIRFHLFTFEQDCTHFDLFNLAQLQGRSSDLKPCCHLYRQKGAEKRGELKAWTKSCRFWTPASAFVARVLCFNIKRCLCV